MSAHDKLKPVAYLALAEGVIAVAIAPALLGVSGATENTLLLPWYFVGTVACFVAGYALLKRIAWKLAAVVVWLLFNVTLCYAVVAIFDVPSLYDDALAPTIVLFIIAAAILWYVTRHK